MRNELGAAGTTPFQTLLETSFMCKKISKSKLTLTTWYSRSSGSVSIGLLHLPSMDAPLRCPKDLCDNWSPCRDILSLGVVAKFCEVLQNPEPEPICRVSMLVGLKGDISLTVVIGPLLVVGRIDARGEGRSTSEGVRGRVSKRCWILVSRGSGGVS